MHESSKMIRGTHDIKQDLKFNEVSFKYHLVAAAILPSEIAGGGEMSDDIDGQPCVVCFRVTDKAKPKVQSERQQCVRCHEPIWVAKEWPRDLAKICTQCMKRGAPTKPAKAKLDRRSRFSRGETF